MRLANFEKCGMCIIHLRVVFLSWENAFREQIADMDGLENWQCFDRRRNDKTQCVILAKSHKGFVLAL